ncbi:glycerophosphodiester phosphodiesterase family protein [Thiofilum flexile]|uniref:glycerophosphodiester phosphodiesterase family protein n=1 Tax=Thiofilum flexile TaxID=125627 RepID=UPI0003755C2E|nr:glycerophosphodiester phosphodiesterase family protein [Thiofilum flexile]
MVMIPPLIAHRGASHDAPENTLAAFRLAWEQGADGIEGDFHLTHDGQIICVHDEVLESHGQHYEVAQTTLADLQAAFPNLPTLAQVLALVPAAKRMVIEVKCGVEIIPTLLTALQNSGLTPEQVMLIAFDAAVIAELKQQAPEWTACWLTELTLNQHGELMPSNAEILSTLQAIKAKGVSTFAHPAIDPAWVEPLLNQGFEWHVWTVDEIALAQHLIACGVQSITTNRPKMLRQALGGWE